MGRARTTRHGGGALVFDWAYAIAVCEAFHDLEAMVVRFTDDAATSLGPSRSVQWLGEEERKHMAPFERYADALRARRPDLARRWDRLPRSTPALPGSGEAEDVGMDPIAAHYVFWLNTLFFEEFTIFLAQCLERDRGLIQPTWAGVHRCHMREEMQHLPTDMAHLDALVLSPAERLTLSKAFLFRLEEGIRVDFGRVPTPCSTSPVRPPACRRSRPSGNCRSSRRFCRTRSFAGRARRRPVWPSSQAASPDRPRSRG